MDDRARKAAERKGYIDQRGIGRGAQARFCRRCGRVVMAGTDSPVAGITVLCDPVPLDSLGELYALVAGLSTYELRFGGGRYEIEARDQFHIAGNPPMSGVFDVLTDHRCGRFNTPGISTRFVGHDNPANPDGPPPF